MIKKFSNLGRLAGFDPMGFAQYVGGIPRFLRDARAYRKIHKAQTPFPLRWSGIKPLTRDFRDSAGTAKGHYFYQDLWAAKSVFAASPSSHVDIGSRIDGFVGHVLSFMPVTVIDVRPLESEVEGLTFIQDDATEMSTFDDNSIESLSSLHAIEHFGLGRYGDPIDPNSCFKAMASLARVLKPGGRLYFSGPVGRERLEFNAHRVFCPDTVMQGFSSLQLVSFACVKDDGEFVRNTTPDSVRNSHFACGMFEFTKDEV